MSPGKRIRVAAAAVPGCQHVLAGGTKCQDAARTLQTEDVVVIAVSDGHGSKKYTHSDEGARTAVDVACEVLAALVPQLAEHPFARDPDALAAELGATVKRRIAWEWNRRVHHHAAMRQALAGKAWPAEIPGEWSQAVKPYGCTLLAAAFTANHAVYFRLGDGEVVTVDAAGPALLFPASDKTMGQETASMSMRNGVDYVQFVVHATPPSMVVLATDGVADPYYDDPTFEDVWGGDLITRIREHGWVEAMMGLPRNLGALARDGDDCTVAVAYWEDQGETS